MFGGETCSEASFTNTSGPIRANYVSGTLRGQIRPSQWGQVKPSNRATRCAPGRAEQRRARLHPYYSSWLNRIEPQFKGLRSFCLAGTDHPDHDTQTRLITDYITWRNDHRDDPKLRHLTRRELARKAGRSNTANVA
jgi:hypothetical protein